MREKIDWYQEVVELEPGSKLFFPLAKMLANNNEIPRALSTLYRGLERNPEFIEARLFLVELLHQASPAQEYAEELEAQLAIVAPLLARYAGFWHAWGENLKDANAQDDTHLALSLMATAFQNKNLSLADIFSAGIKALQGSTESPIQSKPATLNAKEPVTRSNTVQKADTPAKLPANKKTISITSKVKKIVSASANNNKQKEQKEETKEGDEQYSVRTRSMAEVLAEQGNYEEAISIYNELVQAAQTDKEKADLQFRITTLTANLQSPLEDTTQEEQAVASPTKERVLSVLESLAERLESRVTS